MKICNKCLVEREVTEYKKDPRNKNGLNGICSPCLKDRNKELREARNTGLIELRTVVEKKCGTCNETKSIDNFYRDAGMSDGYRTNCKPCKNKTAIKWREENRERYNKTQREYSKNPENYKRLRLQRYDITPEDFDKMMLEQDGKCKLCFKIPETTKRPLCVDHSHTTGKVRGLLCYGCNRLMVLVDNEELLRRALDYSK
jgi:Recombination endonuclease VII